MTITVGLLVGSKHTVNYVIPPEALGKTLVCKLFCCNSCTFCKRAFAKERYKSCCCKLLETKRIKVCEICFLCRSIVFCQTCDKCPNCCLKSICRGKTTKLLENLVGSVRILREGYTLPFLTQPNLARAPTIISCYVNPHRNLYLLEALHQLTGKKYSRDSSKVKISGVLQPTFLGPKTKQSLETHPRPEQTKSFPQGWKIQNGDTRNHQNIHSKGGVGYLNRF